MGKGKRKGARRKICINIFTPFIQVSTNTISFIQSYTVSTDIILTPIPTYQFQNTVISFPLETKSILRRHSSPYCCWSLWWISVDGTFSPTRNLITMRCSTLRGTFCSLITLAAPKQDWTGSNPSTRRVEVVASLSQGRTAAAQCGLFTHKSVPVIFEPPCIYLSLIYLASISPTLCYRFK